MYCLAPETYSDNDVVFSNYFQNSLDSETFGKVLEFLAPPSMLTKSKLKVSTMAHEIRVWIFKKIKTLKDSVKEPNVYVVTKEIKM